MLEINVLDYFKVLFESEATE